MEENLKFEEVQECEAFVDTKKPSVIRKIFFNVLGFFVGYYAGVIAVFLARYIFMDLLGRLKLIRVILSWPVEYEVYALTGIIFVDALVSLKTCGVISKFGKAKRNYSCYFLGGIRIITYVSSAITLLSTDGFNFSFIWTLFISLVGFIIFSNAMANNEEL